MSRIRIFALVLTVYEEPFTSTADAWSGFVEEVSSCRKDYLMVKQMVYLKLSRARCVFLHCSQSRLESLDF